MSNAARRKLLKVTLLNLLEAGPRYRGVTPRECHCFFEGKDPFNITDSSLIGIGVEENGKGVGIALVRLSQHLKAAKVFCLPSVAIQETLELLSQELKKGQCSHVSYFFEREPVLEEALKGAGWSEPDLTMTHYVYDVDNFEADWYVSPSPLPKGYAIVGWKEVSPKAMKALRGFDFPGTVTPFGCDEHEIEPMNSVALVHGEEVVGWMMTHRKRGDLIRYSGLYIMPDHQSKGLAKALLIEAIYRHKSSPPPRPRALFIHNFRQVDLFWSDFIEKQLAPYADEIHPFYSTSLSF